MTQQRMERPVSRQNSRTEPDAVPRRGQVDETTRRRERARFLRAKNRGRRVGRR